MQIHNFPQRSDEWYSIRLGKITASNFSLLLSKGKKKDQLFSVTAMNYLDDLGAELKTGVKTENIVSAVMQRGIDLEDEARDCYSIHTFNLVQEIGFAEFDSHIGCSPDGIVGDEGMIEIKCPTNRVHFKRLRCGEIEPNYVAQIQGNMWILNKLWCDFVSYNPDFQKKEKLWIKRLPRDEKYISNLEERVLLFKYTLTKSLRG